MSVTIGSDEFHCQLIKLDVATAALTVVLLGLVFCGHGRPLGRFGVADLAAIVNGRSCMHWTEPFARFIADQLRRSMKQGSAKARESGQQVSAHEFDATVGSSLTAANNQ
jgi:hypothetical protein